MFWSLLLEPGKRYTKVVESPFHISAAVLDTTSQDHGVVRVIVDIGDTEALIANLSLKHGLLQSPLDLQFDSGCRISFYTTGAKSNVHLSGYVTYEEELFSEDDDRSSDEEVPTLVSAPVKRKPEESPSQGNKKAKLQKVTPTTPNKKVAAETKASPAKPNKKANALAIKGQTAMDSDEDEDDDEDGLDDNFEEEEEDEEEEEEDSDEDNCEEEDDEDESEEEVEEEEEEDSDDEETKLMMANKQKKGKKANNIAAKPDVLKTPKGAKTPGSEGAKTPKGAKTPGNEGAKTPKGIKTPGNESAKTPKGAKTPGGESGVPDKAKKTPNKPQGVNTGAPMQNGKTPKTETPVKDEGKSPKTPKMIRPGGVVCEDLVVGKGPEAKTGKMVSVYYVGRLASNKKMFDKCESGKGFKFRLGGSEVIKGWDVGVSGMRIGGKRKITCPPHMAYGKKGAPPDIPGNAALTFVVELKGVS